MRALFNFTIRQTFCQKKIWFTLLLLILPVGLTLLPRILSPTQSANKMWNHYHIQVNSFIFMMILPLMCMLHGNALIGADAEKGTLAYLLTRKLKRSKVLLVKFAAMVLLLTIMVCFALLIQYIATFAGVNVESLGKPHGQVWQPFSELLAYLFVTPFAVASYLSIFVLISLVASRPLMASIMYAVIVEMFLANLPVGIHVYSITHQIRAVTVKWIPNLSSLYQEFTEMQDEFIVNNHGGIGALGAIILVSLVLSCLLVSTRELTVTKVDND